MAIGRFGAGIANSMGAGVVRTGAGVVPGGVVAAGAGVLGGGDGGGGGGEGGIVPPDAPLPAAAGPVFVPETPRTAGFPGKDGFLSLMRRR
jgi:hypothetical protein